MWKLTIFLCYYAHAWKEWARNLTLVMLPSQSPSEDAEKYLIPVPGRLISVSLYIISNIVIWKRTLEGIFNQISKTRENWTRVMQYGVLPLPTLYQSCSHIQKLDNVMRIRSKHSLKLFFSHMQHTQGSTSFVEETIKPLIHNYFGLTGT